MTFRSHERRMRIGSVRKREAATIAILSQSAPERDPKVQLTMALSCCSLAKNWRIAVSDPKK
jgi:hypothetical protein